MTATIWILLAFFLAIARSLPSDKPYTRQLDAVLLVFILFSVGIAVRDSK